MRGKWQWLVCGCKSVFVCLFILTYVCDSGINKKKKSRRDCKIKRWQSFMQSNATLAQREYFSEGFSQSCVLWITAYVIGWRSGSIKWGKSLENDVTSRLKTWAFSAVMHTYTQLYMAWILDNITNAEQMLFIS